MAGVIAEPGADDLLAQALALRDDRRPAEALALLEQLSWPPAEPRAWLLRGSIEHQLGQCSDALLSLAAAVGHPELCLGACYHLGEVHRALGQFDQAAAWFLAALQHDPSHRYSHNSLQFTRFSDALLPRVVEAYRAFAAQAPEQPLCRQLLAHYLLRSGQRELAVATNRQASALQSGVQAALLQPEATAAACLPQFLVLGVPKGGTSSLLGWLATHPQLWCHPRKELHFFDGDWAHGPDWYASHFPAFQPEAGIRCGEATPNYFQLPQVPERVQAVLPGVRLIVLLRDPLQRALSWLMHLRRFEALKGEPASLLAQELEVLEALEPAALEASGFVWPNALRGSCYNAPLRRWQAAFPPEQLLLLSSEMLFAEPEATLMQVARFLGVEPRWAWGELPAFNVNPLPQPDLPAALHERLQAFLARQSGWALSQLPAGPAV